jgi:hypothetical protein
VKSGAQVALGVVGGYLLGRTKKMKLALALAAMATAGRGQIGLTSVLRSLNAVPEVGRLTGEARSKLLDAGKMAAAAAVSRQIDSLSGRLGVPELSSVGKKAGAAGAKAGDTAGAVGSKAGALTGADKLRKGDQDSSESRHSSDEDESDENESRTNESASRDGKPQRRTRRAGDAVKAGVSSAKAAAPRRTRSRSDDGDAQPARRRRTGDGESSRTPARASRGSGDDG